MTRDCFGRATLKRVNADREHQCKWCGRSGARFIYVWVEDQDLSGARERMSIQGANQNGLVFCSKGCWRSHNE